jgi:hypothetical protein
MNNIWIGIPTGQRAEKAKAVAQAWLSAGVRVMAYCWDRETYDALDGIANIRIYGQRQSFAKLQNLLAGMHDWDVYICGADDLYPKHGIDKLPQASAMCPDKVLCVADGIHTHLPTHPVITRDWYDKHGQIFDEAFNHNFCDTDLCQRVLQADEIVKVNGIEFDHRHPIKTGEVSDEVYKLGQSTYAIDKEYFIGKYPNQIDPRTMKEINV